ncbi:SusD/RagB family nutrient-binding outer membrane lipoprotein [Pedobacter nutrimenti]|uniref:SusD/RagB family nutrient-binding outer membrane lipoprotein n=1 Tax=Pedobacter nutrimenti TaxID=1241337 RepID=UPI002930E22F|nr:SusD/RagB family nutrient-binding outer membrane lipoprotein [Pedobacter nutrimenti]
MKRINIKVLVMMVVVAASFGACKKALDINDDPSRLTPDQANLSGLLGATIQFTATSFFNVGQYGNSYPQYLAGFNSYEANIDSYNPYGFDNIWESAYRDAMPNLKDMIDRAEKLGAPQYSGIGKVLFALTLMQSTDIWGDLPYSQAFKGPTVPSPTYDAQQDIYNTSLKALLDGAIADLAKPVPTTASLKVGTSDLIFGGTIASWQKVAYGARARYYLHLSKKDPANLVKAISDVSSAIDDQKGAVDLQLKYSQERPSPWYTNLGQPAITAKQGRPSYFLVNLMNGTGYFSGVIDPRLPKLFDNAGAATYTGRPVGALSTDPGAILANSDVTDKTYYGARTSPVPILTYAEMQFIKAEALIGTDKAGAYTAYINGIKGNMLKLGVSDADITTYTTNAVVTKNGNITITDIMLQKYIALFLQMETWTDMRRYQYDAAIYPGLKQPNKNLLGNVYVQRAKYPDNEPGRNPNVPKIPNQAQKIWLFN